MTSRFRRQNGTVLLFATARCSATTGVLSRGLKPLIKSSTRSIASISKRTARQTVSGSQLTISTDYFRNSPANSILHMKPRAQATLTTPNLSLYSLCLPAISCAITKSKQFFTQSQVPQGRNNIHRGAHDQKTKPN